MSHARFKVRTNQKQYNQICGQSPEKDGLAKSEINRKTKKHQHRVSNSLPAVIDRLWLGTNSEKSEVAERILNSKVDNISGKILTDGKWHKKRAVDQTALVVFDS